MVTVVRGFFGTHSLGHRGRALVALAVLWIAVGGNLYSVDPTPGVLTPLEYVPTWIRASIWIVPALVALVTAWWPPGADRWGYMLLMIPAGLRVGSYLTAVMFGHFSVLDNLFSWAVIMALIWLFADWPDPPERQGE